MKPEEITAQIIRLRQQGVKNLRELSLDTYRLESAQIVQHFAGWELLRNAKIVAAFFPTRTEPQIQPLLQGLANTRTLLLPRVLPHHQLEFVEIHDIHTELRPATFGLMEPHLHSQAWAGDPPDVILVPGIVYGKYGERIGHGGGYFDRFLPKIPHAVRVGVALNCQFLQRELAIHPHDVRMSYIVSPTGIHPTGV